MTDAGAILTTSYRIEIKEVYFCTPFGMLLGHIVCNQGLLVDPTKIALILIFPPPTNVKQLIATLRHTRYYHKFIRCYSMITTPMDSLIKKDVVFVWSQECQVIFETIKEKMASTPILVFPNWNKEFHVHVDASSVALVVVMAQPGEGDLYHLIAFYSRKLSSIEKNYTTTESEGLAMVYVL